MKFINEPAAASDVHFDATNLEDLQTFRKAFYFDVDKCVALRKKVHEELGGKVKELKDSENKFQEAAKFQTALSMKLLPDFFDPERGKGWNAVIHFKVDELGDYTLKIDGGKATSEEGAVGDPTCVVNTDMVSLGKQLTLIRMEDMVEREEDELSDTDLETVAGGKGGCGSESNAGAACGADYTGEGGCAGVACGAAGCAGAMCAADACGGAACGAAGGIIGVCGAAGCVAAAGAATGCVADACGGAICGAAACGGAVCGGDACGAAACGLAGNVVGACVGDACGAALGAGVCAGNVCGADVLGGADVGPCAVNVIPACPGI